MALGLWVCATHRFADLSHDIGWRQLIYVQKQVDVGVEISVSAAR